MPPTMTLKVTTNQVNTLMKTHVARILILTSLVLVMMIRRAMDLNVLMENNEMLEWHEITKCWQL